MIIAAHEQLLSFHPEEKSFGQVGDDIFLDIRHRIITGHFGPGNFLVQSRLADVLKIDQDLAIRIVKGLRIHGYVVQIGADKFGVKGWSDVEFEAAMKVVCDTQKKSLQQYSRSISKHDIDRLRACVEFSVGSSYSSERVEIFFQRWWMFWHYTLHAYGLESYRTFALTQISPYLRRRMVTGYSLDQLNLTLSNMRQLLAVFSTVEGANLPELVDHYMDEVTPDLIEINKLYNLQQQSIEIQYDFTPISEVPVFQSQSSRCFAFCRGFREPLDWQGFVALGLVGIEIGQGRAI
jgi:DNA-binding GntR family transcriptional regulator